MPKFRIDADLQPFLRDLKQVAKRHPSLLRHDLPELLELIAETPEIFPELVGLTEEVRKARVGVQKASIGKSGGYRLLFQVHRTVNVISLIAIYYKPDNAILAPAEIRRRLKL